MPTLPPDLERAHDAFTTMYDALRSLTYHRALKEVGADDSKFWLHVRAQLIRTFVIEWTKLFGANSNEIHWKKLVMEQPAFRDAALEKANLTENEWKDYWKQMTSFRDKVVAHLDADELPGEVPDMTAARAMLIAGYQWVRGETIKAGVKHKGPKDLEAWSAELYDEARALVKKGVQATKACSETR